jgi:hypothetical protein
MRALKTWARRVSARANTVTAASLLPPEGLWSSRGRLVAGRATVQILRDQRRLELAAARVCACRRAPARAHLRRRLSGRSVWSRALVLFEEGCSLRRGQPSQPINNEQNANGAPSRSSRALAAPLLTCFLTPWHSRQPRAKIASDACSAARRGRRGRQGRGELQDRRGPPDRTTGSVPDRLWSLRHGWRYAVGPSSERTCHRNESPATVEVAAQAGHGPTMTLNSYAHVFEELKGGARLDAEAQIRAARAAQVPVSYPHRSHLGEARPKMPGNPASPLSDSNR